MNRVLQSKIGFVLFMLSFSAMGQQQYDNFDNELDASALILKYPNATACQGSIEISVAGGIAPYKYSIDGGSTFTSSNTSTDLCSDKYFIHVRDASGKLGITYINLVPPVADVDPFTAEEKMAIKARLIADLKVEKSNYTAGSISARKVDWKLWKLQDIVTTDIKMTEETTVSYSFEIATLIPPAITSEQYNSELSRIKEIFANENIELSIDYGTWLLSVKMDKTPSDTRLTDLLNHLGFSTYSIIDQTSN